MAQLPPSTSIKSVAPHLLTLTKNLAQRAHHAQATRHIESAEHMRNQIELFRLQQESFTLTAGAKCPVTGQLLADQPSLLRFPNGTLTVVLPPNKYPRHICPVTGRNFAQESNNY